MVEIWDSISPSGKFMIASCSAKNCSISNASIMVVLSQAPATPQQHVAPLQMSPCDRHVIKPASRPYAKNSINSSWKYVPRVMGTLQRME